MKKMNYNKGTFTILTTSTDGFEYSDYLEHCEINGITPKGENSDDFYEWCEEMAMENYEDDLDNIRNCRQYNVPVVVTGTLGLWDGTHDILARYFDSVYDAVKACISRDSLDVEARFVSGHIEVDAHHHDGCNCFIINALSKKGVEKRPEFITATDTKRLPYLYAIY